MDAEPKQPTDSAFVNVPSTATHANLNSSISRLLLRFPPSLSPFHRLLRLLRLNSREPLMSLAQHLTATEGIDREPPEPHHHHFLHEGPRLAKKLSYDVFQPKVDDTELLQDAVGAFEVSTFKRAAQVCFGVIACILASGLTFGFAALKPILIKEGIYEDLCHVNDAPFRAMTGDACYEQDLRLNLVFTISTIVTNVSTLPVGTFFDRFGPRAASIVGCIFLALGCLLMGLATTAIWIDCLTLGYASLALGGCFIFVPSFHLANAFPKTSGLILALITGAFDASAAVPFVYKMIYESSGGAIDLKRFFLAFLAVPVTLLLGFITFMPAHSYQTVAQLNSSLQQARDSTFDVHSSDDELESEAAIRSLRKVRREEREAEEESILEVLGDREERLARREKEQEIRDQSKVWGALHGKSAREQMASPWFILITLFTLVQMIRMTFFIATVRSQYEYMLGSSELADRINDFFDFALPVGGIVAVPLTGFILDHLSTASVLASLVTLTSLVGISGLIPTLWAGYLNTVLFVLLRPFYYSAMSDYATKVFGFATFGRVYGSIICISGIFSFAQSGLDAATHVVFHNNPTPVNVLMTTLTLIIGSALTLFVAVRGRQVQRAHAKEDAEGAHQGLLGGEMSLGAIPEDEVQNYGTMTATRI